MELRFRKATETTIESLSIIQKTSQQNLQIPMPKHQLSTKLQEKQLTLNLQKRISIQNCFNIPAYQETTVLHQSLGKSIKLLKDKSKRRLQTPAVTPKQIQPSSWKKTRVELSTNLLYHYTPGSAINIFLADASTSNMTSTFE
ncbi:hypothetical protein G9A89_022900 [Geosiphon pyriformis]|nr:hypothetical protein G9A89_022900 [Geosiphon pyriformis]